MCVGEEELTTWRDKPSHGMYHRQIEEAADIEKTYQWLDIIYWDIDACLVVLDQQREITFRITLTIKCSCLHGFLLGTPASSHSPKTCIGVSLNDHYKLPRGVNFNFCL